MVMLLTQITTGLFQLSPFSKVFKRLSYNQLNSFLEKREIM